MPILTEPLRQLLVLGTCAAVTVAVLALAVAALERAAPARVAPLDAERVAQA
jgi:hypothetical protein